MVLSPLVSFARSCLRGLGSGSDTLFSDIIGDGDGVVGLNGERGIVDELVGIVGGDGVRSISFATTGDVVGREAVVVRLATLALDHGDLAVVPRRAPAAVAAPAPAGLSVPAPAAAPAAVAQEATEDPLDQAKSGFTFSDGSRGDTGNGGGGNDDSGELHYWLIELS